MAFELVLFPTLPQWLLFIAGGLVNEIGPCYLIPADFFCIFTILHSFNFIMLMPILLFYTALVFYSYANETVARKLIFFFT